MPNIHVFKEDTVYPDVPDDELDASPTMLSST